MLSTLRKCLALIDPGSRRRWGLLGLLSVVTAAFEALGAVMIVVLLGMVTEPGSTVQLPLAGDLERRFPDVDPDTLFLWACGVIGLFFVLRSIVVIVQQYAQLRLAYNEGVRLSTRLVRAYLSMPYSFHLERNSSELIRNVHDSVDSVTRYVLVPGVALVSEATLVLGVLVVLLVAAPIPTIGAGISLGIVVGILLKLIQPRLRVLGSTTQALLGDSLKSVQESMHGVRDVKLLGREEHFARSFERTRAGLARSFTNLGTLAGLPRIVVETLFVIFIIGFLVLTQVREGSVQDSLSVLGLFAYAVMRVLPALNRIVTSMGSMRFGAAAIDALHADLALLRERDLSSTPVAPLPFRDRIEVDGVSFGYGHDAGAVLREIDLTISRGEYIGLVGPTGGGKTTLVDIVLGLLPPSAGQVRVDGVDIRSDLPGWQRNLGVVSQTLHLIDASLRHNIALGVDEHDIDDAAIERALALAQLDSFVATLPDGLDTVVGERGVRLSGGQRQRVAIARALYNDPSVVVLDEGTSALDNLTEGEVIAAIEGLRGDRTVIAIAHRLTSVRGCDRIVLLRDGRIEHVGTYDELLESSAEFRRMAR